MAGKYQHFIPRFLQDGFRALTKGKKAYLHHKARGVTLTSIGGIGAENYFYSRPSVAGEPTLDDIITEEEGVLTKSIDHLRHLPIGAAVEPNVAAEIIAHFSTRTRNFREFFGTAGDLALQEMSRAISEAENVARLMGLDQLAPNERWRELFEKNSDRNQLVDLRMEETGAPKVLIERIIFMAARELIYLNHGEGLGGIVGLLDGLPSMLKSELADFHNNALLESRRPLKRLSALSALKWHIWAAPLEGAILPDCVVLGRGSRDSRLVSYLTISGDDLEVVVMPISSRKMLVGVQEGVAIPVITDFNIDAAANSAEFFIASEQTATTKELLHEIGKAWSGKIDELIDNSMGDYRPIQRSAPIISTQLIDVDQHKVDRSENDATSEITKLVKLYYQVCPRTCNLDRLETITFADELNHILSEIDLGPSPELRAEPSLQEIIAGAAVVSVRRGDELRAIILMDAGFFRALTESELSQRQLARSALLLCFAQVSTIARIEADITGFMLNSVSYSDHDALVHCAIRNPIRAYWAGRDVALVSDADTIIREVAKFAVDTLTSSIAGIVEAKKALGETEDQILFFTNIVAEASKFFAQVARLMGLQHGSGVADQAVLPLCLAEALRPYELETWAMIFGKDLRTIWEKDRLTLSDLYPMNLHVERFLMSFGVLVWQDEINGLTRCAAVDL